MVFTPLDIHNKEFKRAFRGYAEEEVDDFLDKIAKEYEVLYKENLDLKEMLDKKDDNIGKYKDLEETLKNTLVVAQQTAEDIKKNSQKEAELVLQQSKTEAESILQQSKTEAEATSSNAQREAERLVYQAKNEAHDIVTEAKQKVNNLTAEYENLVADYQRFQLNCKALLTAQLELLQSGYKPLEESYKSNEKEAVSVELAEEKPQDNDYQYENIEDYAAVSIED